MSAAFDWHIVGDLELEHDTLPARWRPMGRVSVFDRARGGWVRTAMPCRSLREAYDGARRLLEDLAINGGGNAWTQ